MNSARAISMRDAIRTMVDRVAPVSTDPVRQDRMFALLDAWLIEFADVLLEETGGLYVPEYIEQRMQSFLDEILVTHLIDVLAERVQAPTSSLGHA